MSPDGGIRYFAVTAMAGRLSIQWDDRPHYLTEEQVDAILKPTVGDRKVDTVVELEDALKVSKAKPLPSIMLWILEGLEEEARRRREAPC